MNYTFFGENNAIAYVESKEILLFDAQAALDLIATVQYETDCSRIVLNKEAIREEFFRLSSGVAGEVLQKFVNYRTKLAIVGDFSSYTSKPLQDFIYECNKGKDVFFVGSLEEAVEKLAKAN